MPLFLFIGLEGAIVASEDQIFHSNLYLALGILFIAYQSAVRNLGLGIKGVWIGIAAYQWLRMLAFGIRVKMKLIP
jgi:Na+-driven multidrug efflux pump